jgi:hypothetical protein
LQILGDSRMDISLLNKLLYEEENTTLDFKRNQYKFVKATDNEKSELLKDVLAFANAWRRADAYILIGVQEVKGGKSIVKGISEHFDDADLQQFINKKTNRVVHFSYETVAYSGMQIGVIKISTQERPIFLRNDFGKLRRNVVYIRRGSTTDEATPDEVVIMSKEDLKISEPALDVEFADYKNKINLGKEIEGISKILKIPLLSDIPMLHSGDFPTSILNPKNSNYYRQKAVYLSKVRLLNKFFLSVKNNGNILANNVRIEIKVKKESDLYICDESKYPKEPKEDSRQFYMPRLSVGDDITVEETDEHWFIEIYFKKVQPKAISWTNNPVYIGSKTEKILNLSGTVFADNISEPININLIISIKTQHMNISIDEICAD